MVAAAWMTLEEFTQLPEDGCRHELIRGVLYHMPPTEPRHGRVVYQTGRFGWRLRRGERPWRRLRPEWRHPARQSSEIGSVLDLVRYQASRAPQDEGSYPDQAPDLVVEVASPADSGPPMAKKIDLYLAAGVRLV